VAALMRRARTPAPPAQPTRAQPRIDWTAIEALHATHLTSDSRTVTTGDTFVAYPGESRDGRAFIPDALARGAGSVIWERRDYVWDTHWQVPNVGIEDLKRHAGVIAGAIYREPSARLWMIGVTGTNGKTSCSQWIAQALTRTGRRCGVIGTLGSGWPGKLEPLLNTTPDAVWLQGRLRDYLRQRTQAVSMEVSSIGLAQHRVEGVSFDVALFTNLTRDHLDYHGSMARYRSAKAALFRAPGLKWGVFNLDDPFGVELLTRARSRGMQVLGYGCARTLARCLRGRRVPRIVTRKLRVGPDGLAFEAMTPWGGAAVRSPLLGRFNAANLLATLGVLLASGVPVDEAAVALEKLRPVAGRTERYGGGRRPLVIVDYAHTPDALENVLRALREAMAGQHGGRRGRSAPKLVCVFGCGGDRDRGKRPLMGRIARALADEVIVTSDNPRTEDPHAIIADIVAGIDGEYRVLPDRSEAIRAAIAAADAGDIVVVAGKGHEQYQEIGHVRHPYSDAVAVQAALGERHP
jgi:UDP-N-acetylmuramoyl-L-alanyl-D-glutamate--2,6-diaminopimelate ligase